MDALETVYIIVGFILGIALIIGIFYFIYYIVKRIYLDIKDCNTYRDYWKKYFEEKYNDSIEKAKNEYELQLRSKSEGCFIHFYEEEMKKKREENQNGNQV